MKPTLSSLALAAVLVLGTAACGGDSGSGSSEGTTTAAPGAGEAVEDAPDFGRVLALGEEFLLADLLSLGITPVASTATSSDAGWQGLDDFDTDGIEILPNTEANIEQLAALDVDTVIALQYVVDQVGMDTLEALGTVIVAPTGTGPEELIDLGEQLGREDEAVEVVAELDAANAKAVDAAGDDCEVSVATIYPGPTPAAWVAAPNNVAIALEAMGCTLVPSAADEAPDGAGRVYLSLENLGRLSAPQLILLQTSSVEGEDEALADVEDSPVWQGLPAVEAGNVTTVDRLGFPGAAGLIRLYDELAQIVG